MPALSSWLPALAAMAAMGTWLARCYALRRNMLDQPGERRSHAVATARGGGIGIVVAVLAATVWLACATPADPRPLAAFAIGLVLVAGIGWIDDHRPLSPWSRLLVQSLAAAIIATTMVAMTGKAWQWPVAFALIVGMVNVWNFMDGINGLAASQAALAALAMALILPAPLQLLAWALLAACCGFLPFNFPSARIFMGDVGSGALGYVIAVLLLCAWASTDIAWPLLLLPVSAFLVDAGFTLSARMLAGERWWAPHTQHVYQRWAQCKGSHVPVTLAYAGFSVVAIAIMLYFAGAGFGPMWISATAWLGFTCMFWFLLRKGMRDMKTNEKKEASQ